MSRPISKGTGAYKTIYFPVELLAVMGPAMAATQQPVFNQFIGDAVRYYCEYVLDNVDQGEEADSHGKEEA